MEPVISPWFIYFADLANGTFLFFLGMGILTTIMTIGWSVMESDEGTLPKRWYMWFLIPIFFFTLSWLTPNTNTVYKMVAAKYLTVDKANKILKSGQDLHRVLKKDVLDIIKELKR